MTDLSSLRDQTLAAIAAANDLVYPSVKNLLVHWTRIIAVAAARYLALVNAEVAGGHIRQSVEGWREGGGGARI